MINIIIGRKLLYPISGTVHSFLSILSIEREESFE